MTNRAPHVGTLIVAMVPLCCLTMEYTVKAPICFPCPWLRKMEQKCLHKSLCNTGTVIVYSESLICQYPCGEKGKPHSCPVSGKGFALLNLLIRAGSVPDTLFHPTCRGVLSPPEEKSFFTLRGQHSCAIDHPFSGGLGRPGQWGPLWRIDQIVYMGR